MARVGHTLPRAATPGVLEDQLKFVGDSVRFLRNLMGLMGVRLTGVPHVLPEWWPDTSWNAAIPRRCTTSVRCHNRSQHARALRNNDAVVLRTDLLGVAIWTLRFLR
jgi:hypothetical protein